MNAIHRLRGRRGFTLTELLIVILIAGVVLALGVPRFAGYLRYLTSRSTTSQVVSDLALARTQAAREGQSVSFRVLNATTYRVTVDDAAGTAVRTIKTVRVEGPQQNAVTLSPTGQRVSFDSRGMRTSGTQIVVVNRPGRADTVSISLVGRVYRVRR